MSTTPPAGLSRRALLTGAAALGVGLAATGGGRLRSSTSPTPAVLGDEPLALRAAPEHTGRTTPLPDLAALAAEVGAGEPVCFVDLGGLEANLALLASFAADHGWSLRPSLKSLQSPEFTGAVLAQLPEPRGMVFHLRHVDPIVAAAPEHVDLLTGYVPTLGELAAHLARPGPERPHRLRLTVDSLPLLERTIELARDGARALPVELCFELDAGSGRGGFTDVDDVVAAARLLVDAPDAVRLTALLCYDGHATLSPATPLRRTIAADARRRLARLHDALREAAGGAVEELEINGPGSSNYTQWVGDELLTEISPGSALLYARYLRAGFDDDALELACVLAAPVLRVVGRLPRVPLTAIELPGADRDQLMLKGGGWPSGGGRQPTMIWPEGLEDNELYGGRGNNTGTVTAPAGSLGLGDYLLLWPHQVGDAIDHFGAVTAVRDGRVEASWPTFARWGA